MLTHVSRWLTLAIAACVVLSANAAVLAEPSEEQYAVAAGHYDHQQWELAIKEFQTFLRLYPDDRRASQSSFFLAEALLQLGKYDPAREQFHAYIGREPEGKYARAAWFRAGEAAFLAGNLAAARPELEGFLAKYPNDRLNAYVLPYLGDIALAGGDAARAAELFRDGLKRFPVGRMQEDCRLGLAKALEKMEKPADADALWAAAVAHEKLKQHQQAAAIYERLAKDYPQYPKIDAVLYQWAWAQQDLGKPDDAGRLFDRLHQEFPQSRFWGDATCRLAQRAYEAKDYQRAAALLAEVLNPQSASGVRAEPADASVREYAMFLRGQIAGAKADWPAAREILTALLKEYPDTRRRLAAEFWIAEAYYRQGDYAAAGSRFEQLSSQIKDKREPWMAMIPLRRAQVLALRNQWSEAQAIASKIGEDFPKFEQQYEVDYLLGRCLANQADFDAARLAYQRVIRSSAGEKTETAAMAQWMMGESYFHQKNYALALREYSRLEILDAYPTWQAAALLQAGKCRERLGEGKEAADLYRRILKNYPKTSFVEEARLRLDRLEKATPAK